MKSGHYQLHKGKVNMLKGKHYTALTHPGRVRNTNEDNIGVLQDQLFIVADGVGGNPGGEVASKILVQSITEAFTNNFPSDNKDTASIHQFFHESIQNGNRKIFQEASENHQIANMATTLAAAYFAQKHVLLAHVGDSRIYRYNDKGLELLTKDHSIVQQMLDRHEITSEEAFSHPWKNIITQSIGHGEDVDIDIDVIPSEPGDLFLLCSDGLSDMVQDVVIEEILDRNRKDLQKSISELLNRALENGGKDNISIILAEK